MKKSLKKKGGWRNFDDNSADEQPAPWANKKPRMMIEEVEESSDELDSDKKGSPDDKSESDEDGGRGWTWGR